MHGSLSFGRLTIVVLWLCLLYVHYRAAPQADPSAPAREATVAAPGTASDGEERWTGVYLGKHKVGYSYERLAVDGPDYRFEERSLMRMNILGSTQTVHATVHGVAGPELALRSFSLSIRSGAGVFAAHGTIGAGYIDLRVKTGGEERHQQIPCTEPVYVPLLARERLARQGLRPGAQITVPVFDPTSMQPQPLRLEVVGRELESAGARWHVREELRHIETDVWLDAQGRVVRERGPLGFVTVRETQAEAMTGWSTEQAFDLMAAVSIPVQHAIDAARTLQHLTIRLDGVRGVVVPTDDRQHVDGATLVVARESLGDRPTYRLPYRDEAWQGELVPTLFLQSDHPRIRTAAGEALGGETDARRAAELLRRWVFARLQKRPVASIPNALEALNMGAGDCNEHAVLFAALARAAGLPARVVAGLVYADGAFLYHAWNEVWLGTSWVSVDATMDQMPADATHIKLIAGGPEAHAGLVPLIGQLSIEVVSAG